MVNRDLLLIILSPTFLRPKLASRLTKVWSGDQEDFSGTKDKQTALGMLTCPQPTQPQVGEHWRSILLCKTCTGLMQRVFPASPW